MHCKTELYISARYRNCESAISCNELNEPWLFYHNLIVIFNKRYYFVCNKGFVGYSDKMNTSLAEVLVFVMCRNEYWCLLCAEMKFLNSYTCKKAYR